MKRLATRTDTRVTPSLWWGAKSMDYDAIIPYLKNAIKYYESEFQPVIYPDHKTPEEKAEKAKQKARVAAARRRAIAKMKEQQ